MTLTAYSGGLNMVPAPMCPSSKRLTVTYTYFHKSSVAFQQSHHGQVQSEQLKYLLASSLLEKYGCK